MKITLPMADDVVIVNDRTFCVLLVTLLTVCFLIIPLIMGVDAYFFPILGGIVGSLCSSYVIFQYYCHQEMRAPPMALLLWRSVCDLGLGLRFLLTPAFNMIVCGSPKCIVNENVSYSDEHNCAFGSAIFEFLEISGEVWFLCIAIDLLNTKTNPFSNFKSLMRYYHFFAWGAGFVFALPTLSPNQEISGFWTIQQSGNPNNLVDSNVFCWLQMRRNSQTYVPFLMFYVPLMISFSFASVVLFQSFRYLRRGLSYTFVHRLRVLFINTINLTSCLIYWVVLLGVYGGVYIASDANFHAAKVMQKILVYLIPSKGTSTVIVWVLVKSLLEDLREVKRSMKADHKETMWISESGELEVDANVALRKQVLLYASEGIRKTAKRSKEIASSPADLSRLSTKNHGNYEDLPKIRIFMKLSSQEKDEDEEHQEYALKSLSFYGFILLIMGFKTNMKKYLELLYKKGKEEEGQLDNFRDSVRLSNMTDARSYKDAFDIRSQMALDQISEGTGQSSESVSSDVLKLREHLDSTTSVDSGGRQKSHEDRFSERLTMEINPERPPRNTIITASSLPPPAPELTHEKRESEDEAEHEGGSHTSKRGESDSGGSTPSRSDVNSGSGALGGHRSSHSTRGAVKSTGRESFTISNNKRQYASSTSRMSIVETDEVFDFKDVTEEPQGMMDYVSDLWDYLVKTLWNQEIDYRVEFTEHMPYHFRRVRLSSSFDDDFYRNLFVEKVKDRLTQGGASGALFFYCKDEVCIAKSVTESELQTLLTYGRRYCDYMCSQKDSYICKIFGVYTLQIYGSKLHFFVMNNLFYNKMGHNSLEKYDIKGSWINRNAKKPRYGSWQTCIHCENKFFYTKPVRGGERNKRSNHNQGSPRHQQNSIDTLEDSEVVSPIARAGGSSSMQQSLSRTPLDVPSPRVSMTEMVNMHRSIDYDSSTAPTFAIDNVDVEVGEVSSSTQNTNKTHTSSTRLDSVSISSAGIGSRCRWKVDGMHEPEVTFKDNDLREKILLDAGAAAKLRETLKQDAGFLRSLNVMDYSLVIGVHRTIYDVKDIVHEDITTVGVEAGRRTSSSFGSELDNQHIQHFQKPSKVTTVRGPDCYYMGILDFQQEWTMDKMIERALKVFTYGLKQKDGISAVDPDYYFDRFCDKIDELFLTESEYLMEELTTSMEEILDTDEDEERGYDSIMERPRLTEDVVPPPSAKTVPPPSGGDGEDREEEEGGHEGAGGDGIGSMQKTAATTNASSNAAPIGSQKRPSSVKRRTSVLSPRQPLQKQPSTNTSNSTG